MARTFLWVTIFIVSAIFMVDARRPPPAKSSSDESETSEEVFENSECKQLKKLHEIYRSVRNGVCKEKSKTCAIRCVGHQMGFYNKEDKIEIGHTLKNLGKYLTGEARRKFEIIVHRCFREGIDLAGEEKFAKGGCKTTRKALRCALKRSQALGCLLDSHV